MPRSPNRTKKSPLASKKGTSRKTKSPQKSQKKMYAQIRHSRARTREEKFCSCVLQVSKQYPQYSPYGVCTSSLYNKQGLKRTGPVECASKLRYEEYSEEDLRGYAKMKKIRGAQSMNREALIHALYEDVQKRKAAKSPRSPRSPLRRAAAGI